MEQQTRMVDCLDIFVEVNSPELKEEPIHEELLIKDELIMKDEVGKKGNEIDDDKQASLSEFLKFDNVEDSNPIPISLEDTILKDFEQSAHQSQFSNITQANLLYSSRRIACPKCGELLMSNENLESHLQCCKPIIQYLCDKCPFVTSQESIITHHTETTHTPKKCPKCKILCENQAIFLLHYQCCHSKDDIYSCEKCNYQCGEVSMLNFHIKLMHSSGQVVINIDKNTDTQRKCVNLTLQRENSEKIALSVKTCNTKINNDSAKQNDIVDPVLSQNQRNSVGQDYLKAPIAKVCRACNVIITSKVTVNDRCRTCNKPSMFRCNQCNRHFENYRKVSLHLWTECVCLEYNFGSPCCNKYHPNSVVPDLAEYKVIESNIKQPDNAKEDEQKTNANNNMPIRGSFNFSRLSQIRKFAQFIIWYCPNCRKDTKLESCNSHVQTCEDCKTSMWCKCAKCKKKYKKWHDHLVNHLKTVCYREELLEN